MLSRNEFQASRVIRRSGASAKTMPADFALWRCRAGQTDTLRGRPYERMPLVHVLAGTHGQDWAYAPIHEVAVPGCLLLSNGAVSISSVTRAMRGELLS
jgi:hypothetical protein